MEDRLDARPAAQALRHWREVERRARARQVEALCELAETYRVDEAELIEVLTDQLRRVGGEGTPSVSEFVSLEVAGLLGCSVDAATGKLADAIDLKHRHRGLFDAVLRLEIEADRALRAAHLCRELRPEDAARVTCSWLPRQRGKNWTAAFNDLTRLIVEADPALAAAREREAARQRGVWFWGLHEGSMNLTGKLEVLDAKLLKAAACRMAEVIAPDLPGLSADQLRARALGILANPAEALARLQGAVGQPAFDLDSRETRSHYPEPVTDAVMVEHTPGPAPAPLPPEPDDATVEAAAQHQAAASSAEGGQTARTAAHHPDGHGRCPAALCGAISVPLSRLRPRLGVVFHLGADSFGHLSGAARVEHAGTITTQLLAELLGEGRVEVTIQPVIDLPELATEDPYAPSGRMRAATELAFPVEPFPYSGRSSRGLDLDHTIAYRAGPPGQTRIGNLAPLTRRVHRAKTAGHWRMDQPVPGRIRWRSPLGFHYTVTTDPTGTITDTGTP